MERSDGTALQAYLFVGRRSRQGTVYLEYKGIFII